MNSSNLNPFGSKSLFTFFSTLVLCILMGACSQSWKAFDYPYEVERTPSAPDYSQEKYWAALPGKEDPSDLVPDPSLKLAKDPQVDVFFVHPTTFWKKPAGPNYWNGSVDDPELNATTDDSTIKHQASVFNGSCRVYAPRYRQAHIRSYYTENKVEAKQAFDLAYGDVVDAFQYYLEHYNQGRPFIVASHSQGTTHSGRLLLEHVDGQTIQNRLVAAYLVGMQVPVDTFKYIPHCKTENDTGCFMSWRTYKKGYYPPEHKEGIACTNPLCWSTEEDTYIEPAANKGGVLWKFDGLKANLAGGQIHDGMLWIDKPKFFGNFLYNTKNYHAGDFNIFYMNIRENVSDRINAFWK